MSPLILQISPRGRNDKYSRYSSHTYNLSYVGMAIAKCPCGATLFECSASGGRGPRERSVLIFLLTFFIKKKSKAPPARRSNETKQLIEAKAAATNQVSTVDKKASDYAEAFAIRFRNNHELHDSIEQPAFCVAQPGLVWKNSSNLSE